METKDKTINKRQSLVLTGILAMFIAAGGYLYYRYQANTYHEQKHFELQAISELKINQLVQWRRERTADARVISTLPYLIRDVDQWLRHKTNFKLKEDIKELLTIPQNEYRYQDVFLSSTNGELLLSVGGKLHDFDSAVSEKVKNAALVDSLVSSDFYYCKTENTIHYDIIAPLRNETNLTIAMLVLRINPYDYLYPFIQSWPTPSKSSETLIIRRDDDSVLFLNELRFRTGSAMSFKVPLTRKEVPAVQSVLGFEGIFEGKDYRGVDVLAFNHQVPGTSWYMVAKVDQSEIYSDLFEQAIFISVITVILMLMCVIGVMSIYRYRQRNIYKTLCQTQEEFRTTLLSIGDAVIATDKSGRVQHMNYVAEQLTGWKEKDAKDKLLENVFHIVNEDTRVRIENPVELVLKEGHVVGLANHTLLISKEGRETPIADSGSPIRDDKNEIIGVVLVFRDQTEERASQKLLYTNEGRLRAILNATPFPIALVDLQDNNIEFWSDSALTLFGHTAPTTQEWYQIAYPDPRYRQELMNRWKPFLENAHLSGQTLNTGEYRITCRDGSVRICELYATFLIDKLIVTFNDITERKRGEEEILKLNRTYAVLSTINELIVRENNRGKLLEEVCEIAVQDGKFRMSWIGMLDEKTGRVDPVAGAGVMDGYLENLHITISDTPRGRGPTGIALREGRVVLCDDIEHDDRMIPWRERALALGYCSSAALPLMVNDKAIGVINFYSTDLNYFHEEEVRLLEELAMNVSYALKSFEIEEQRRQTEEKLEYERHLIDMLLESIPDHIYFKDKESRFIRVNKSQAQIFGLSDPHEVIGKTDFDFFLEEHAKKAYQDEQMIIQTGKSKIDVEEKETWPDGSITWVSTTKVPLRDSHGHIIGTFGISRDITERKQVEESLRKSEKKLSNAMEIALLGTWEYDVVMDRFTFNDQLYSIMHTTAEKEGGYTISSAQYAQKFIHADDRSMVRSEIQKALESTDPDYHVQMDHRIIFGDGTKGYITVSSYIEKDVNGRTVRTFGVNQDITERKQVEEELMKNEALMRTAVENLPLIFYMIDREGKFKLSIGAGLKRLGLKPNQIVDQSVYEVYKEYPKIIVSIKKSLEGESVTFDSNISGASFVNFLTPLNVLKGTSEGIVGVAMDVTEQKILQKELLQAQKMESVGTLAGGIAHDFNNILGIILAYSSMLERNAGDKEKISEYGDIIGQAVNRGAGLVRQILTFARKTDVALAPMSIIDLLHELISMLRQTFPKVITFTEIIENEIPVINADRTQIYQVLMNLCVNARDAMPTGGSITIKAEKQTKDQVHEKIAAANQDSYVCITVTDTGTGMNEETRRRIFDPFYTTKEQGKGTGLGLAVVYGVVQSHHGFIDVESEVGHGTTFRLYFPIPPMSEQMSDVPLVIESFSTGGTETILVVEDEEALIEMVHLLLESKGYKVFTAQNGKDAVETFKQHKQEIDVVLTDMGLPGMTGADEFKMLKEIAPNVKVIFASGFFEPVIKSDLYIAGAKGFIQKPYSPDEVLRKLRDVLDTKV